MAKSRAILEVLIKQHSNQWKVQDEEHHIITIIKDQTEQHLSLHFNLYKEKVCLVSLSTSLHISNEHKHLWLMQ